MFKLRQQDVLDDSKWAPGEKQLRYIEVRTFADAVDPLLPGTFHEGELKDQEVEDWLHQRGRFAHTSDPYLGKEQGCIRLLICERLGFIPLTFGLSKASLLAIEEKFRLPTEMLPLFKFNGGGHSYHFRPSVPHGLEPEELVITIKVPQMNQVANYGLCLSHSFKTRVTSGFMFGWNMFDNKNWEACMEMKRPKYLELHGLRISKLIRSEIANCGHPLLLPVILLEDHIYNADRFKGFSLSPRTTKLEAKLRATKAGRSVNSTRSLNFEVLSEEMIAQRFELITDINTIITDVVTFNGNLKWDHRYCQFLRDISDKIRKFSKMPSGEQELENTIETLNSLAFSISEHGESLKARLDIQLNVLYNLVAQVDSNVNSTIAATTGLDSVAMKALAFVTMMFLPPTFVATLFSMSMFDWQSDETAQPSNKNGGSKVVSQNFGIYWMISVPLTVIVLSTWGAWWHREQKHYQKKYPHVKLDQNLGTTILDKIDNIMWKRKRSEDLEKLD